LFEQTSLFVQRFWSSQVPLLAVYEQPIDSEQKSSVQVLLSLQSASLGAWPHEPSAALQVSAVHETPSSQVLAGCWQVPSLRDVLQTSAVHRLPSSHSATAG